MLRVGVLGYGYWGPNLARNFKRTPGCQLVRIADVDPTRLEHVRHEWPDVEVTSHVHHLTQAADIDAVAIATPARTHYELAREALCHDKHVLVEKPMAVTVRHAEELAAEASRRGLVLMVDHTFVYTEAVRWLREFVSSGRLGDLYYFDSTRANLGIFQHDASVLWDLAPHDLSILHDLFPLDVRSVSTVGACHAGSRVPDIAYINVDLGDGRLAHVHVSWLSPVKVRRTLIAGSHRMIVFDDLEATEKLKVYDNGVEIEHGNRDGEHRMRVEYRVGDLLSPALPAREALRVEIDHFVDCVHGRSTPRTGPEAGLAVVRILEAAQRSMDAGGERVAL